MKMKNKRGNALLDMFLIPAILVITIVFFFLGYYVYNIISTETDLFDDASEDGSTAQGEIGDSASIVFNMLPYIFIMILVSIIVGLALTAYLVDSSVVFLVVGIILLMITIVISVPISNFYEEFRAESDFSDVNDAFSVANSIMSHLPYYVLFIGGAFLIILFGKKSYAPSSGFEGGGFYE